MELLQLAIVGAVVSLLVQAIKKWAGTEGMANIAIVVGVSVVAGAVYFYAKDTAFWPVFVQILSFAGAVYSFLIKQFEAEK